MGSKTRTFLMTSVCLVFVTGISIAKEFPTGDPQAPGAVIESETGIGTSESKIVAKISKQAVVDWCENWKPGEESCLSEMKEDIGKTFTATANCQTGTMTDPSGQKLKYVGRNYGDDFYNYFQFENIETRTKIGFSSDEDGVSLMAQWMSLCPYGLPYSVLPMTDTIYIHDAKYEPLRHRPEGSYYESAGHNGKRMLLDYDLGTITYADEQSATIPENRVLFRGSISIEDGIPTRGMAFVFKKGCQPQPYYVEGYYNARKSQIVLTGDAPVWDGCKVSGYSSKSKNSKLVFQYNH